MGVEISENLTFLFNLSGGLSYREDDKKKIKKIYPTAGIPIEFYVLYVWGDFMCSGRGAGHIDAEIAEKLNCGVVALKPKLYP
jgi:formylmethanofuran dehydrogenase subunit E-like metal-binding protein